MSIICIGSFLVNRLRAFFKENYFLHSQTIIASIALTGFGVIAMLCFNIVRLKWQGWLTQIQETSISEQDWTFPAIYCGLIILGEFFPIFSQVGSIKLSIMGNWNELYQSELQEPDEACTVHSKMFADFR